MVIVRTLDLGADKQAEYLNLPVGPNPALGYRAIRILPCAAGPFSRPTPRNLPRCCVWNDCGHVSHDHICMAGTAE